jgi:hypothetical protein
MAGKRAFPPTSLADWQVYDLHRRLIECYLPVPRRNGAERLNREAMNRLEGEPGAQFRDLSVQTCANSRVSVHQRLTLEAGLVKQAGEPAGKMQSSSRGIR